ncbi:class D beta-lactamase [Chromobacterium alticapitis]|uniref:beta-lactamase n=1 Tax=Chromobacterium alticapitis TaxID=2073169 RepID=A0A2S5DLL8_9NEIS|nr:class D beta-lactamase [Chromobacterium alticapitis]POZ63947.1 class D beta-lactamase [Chromobacterium alticapitis]
MKKTVMSASLLLAGSLLAAAAQGRTVCTVIAAGDSGRVLRQEGDCATRVTPASTFKIALAVMGYDAGLLRDEHAPLQPYRQGYADWGGDNWRQPTDPTRWLKYSVVWYSQLLTRQLGEDKLARYARAFGYGNGDFSGDPGKRNGLERAWIGSSLKISPLEQVAFLYKLLKDQLPASRPAQEMTRRIVERVTLPDGWTIHGKTGMAYPRLADGSQDLERPYGWFVGWAEQGGRRMVFARLIQDEGKTEGTAGVRAREAWLREWPGLAAGLPR